MTSFAPITIRHLAGFHDSRLTRECWNRLVKCGPTDTVFLTWEWQSTWWNCFGRGELLLLAAEQAGRLVALAPFFSDAGMVYFVGSGGSDYLDFLGALENPEILEGFLTTARTSTRGFIGLVLYHLPERSPTVERLREAAKRVGLALVEEGSLPAPLLELEAQRELALAAPQKKSFLRHQRYLERTGQLEIKHTRCHEAIAPCLDAFFDQHQRRWATTAWPSLFDQPSHQQFYRRLSETASDSGWLRFTEIVWNGRQIAFHFGFCYNGRFLWYKPSFEVDLAQLSPGEVLQRQLLLAALSEGAHTYDFGLGDEPFKRRFATRIEAVHTYGLYEPSVITTRSTTPAPAL
jgi:CelD/BcsL family acetyltransferase involved in cellulose biosynthesis